MISVRIGEKPGQSIAGNYFVFAKRPGISKLHYVIVSVDGVDVGQQSYYFYDGYYWIDDFFVAKKYRNGEPTRRLRTATFMALAELTDECRALVGEKVASIDRVLEDPLRRELGVVSEVVGRRREKIIYRFSQLSKLRP